jgi:cell division protein FtsL
MLNIISVCVFFFFSANHRSSSGPTLKQEVTTLKQEVAKLTKENTTLKQEVATLNAKLTKENTARVEENAAQNTKITALNTTIDAQNTKITALNTTIDNLAAFQMRMQSEVNSLLGIATRMHQINRRVLLDNAAAKIEKMIEESKPHNLSRQALHLIFGSNPVRSEGNESAHFATEKEVRDAVLAMAEGATGHELIEIYQFQYDCSPEL